MRRMFLGLGDVGARRAVPGSREGHSANRGGLGNTGGRSGRPVPVLFALLFVSVAWGQGDPLEQHFVPPEVIMQHQGELGITDSQREQIKQRVSQAQVRFTELQWDLQAHVEGLSELLADLAAEESRVLEQLDKVLATEGQIKRAQVSMLMGLRKVLTPEQLAEARKLMRGTAGLKKHMGELEREMRRVREEMLKVQKLVQMQMQLRKTLQEQGEVQRENR